MTCLIVYVLHANNVDISEMPFPNNINYSHLGGKSSHIFNSMTSLIDISLRVFNSLQHPREAKQMQTPTAGFYHLLG